MNASAANIVEADIVVVGSGSTGMVAALTAAEGGAKVILLEKMRSMGGVSNFAEGMFAAESDMQRQQYVSYTRDDAFKTIMEYSHWRANPRLVRAFVDESAATISWLQEKGVEFVEVTTNMPGGPLVWHILKGPERERGSLMIKTLASQAKDKGVDFWLATSAKRIIKEASLGKGQSGGNKVTGIIVEKDGEEFQIKAKAIIIATGGYANNREWIKKYTGFDLGMNLIPIGNVDKMGDGIRMAWEIGAAEEGIGVLHLLKGGPVMGAGLSFMGPLESAANQPSLWVNQDGERYCDESIQGNFAFDGNALARQKGRSVFAVFDESLVRHWMENGTDLGIGRIFPPGSRVNIGEALKEALETKTPDVFGADSIEELAREIGLNLTLLKATVDEYNGFCAKGHDDLFAKDPKYLRPLRGPKFYALKCNLVFLGTLGGIKINHKMEVVDKKESPIPGLYTGGMDAGGIYGDSYDVKTCGGTLSFGVNSGRIAAKNALKYIASLPLSP
jgi:fumarate reductase flavoprotein subunit